MGSLHFVEKGREWWDGGGWGGRRAINDFLNSALFPLVPFCRAVRPFYPKICSDFLKWVPTQVMRVKIRDYCEMFLDVKKLDC